MRLVRAVWFCLLFICAGAASAVAHPLGNFTINHLGKISAANGQLKVRYILDIAEIPTFQIMQTHGGVWNTSTLQAWANDEIPLVQNALHVSVDGSPATLEPHGAHASLRPGAGGLPILRWVSEFTTPTTAGAHTVSVDDGVYSDRRIGWKDLIAGSQTEPTDELQKYPSALIGTPRRISALTFALNGASISHIVATTDATPVVGTTAYWISPAVLSDMFTRPSQTPLFIFLTILAAFGLGAMHAIEPGHGKALLAFTLVGARATKKQALILAASLTLAHTIGVFILGAVLFFITGFVSETIYPWITLISGIVIAFIGARSLARFVRGRRMQAVTAGHEHGHDHGHGHSHDEASGHSHDHDHGKAAGHSHVIPGTQPLNFSAAVWAAMSGGIAPCPAAIVVLLAALRLHHLGYGMLLIVIFSMGLATVLSALGLGVVHGAAWLSRRSSYARLVPYGPLVTSTVISVIGSIMLAQGLNQEGVSVSFPLLAAAIIAAIGGFALTQLRGRRPVLGHGEAQTV